MEQVLYPLITRLKDNNAILQSYPTELPLGPHGAGSRHRGCSGAFDDSGPGLLKLLAAVHLILQPWAIFRRQWQCFSLCVDGGKPDAEFGVCANLRMFERINFAI